jgi:hypothetical protein
VVLICAADHTVIPNALSPKADGLLRFLFIKQKASAVFPSLQSVFRGIPFFPNAAPFL